MSRARRSNVKKVDYSKEQQFSDEDLFEDEDQDQPPKAAARRSRGGGRPRKSEQVEEDLFIKPDNHYTEKGYDPSLPPIRERFTFLPEYEDDGSPKIELIVGRRPVDAKGENDMEKKDGKAEEEKEAEATSPAPRQTKGRRKTRAKDPSPQKTTDDGVVEYEYLVKYRGRSYLHLEWKSGADLESMNKSAKGMYRRYLKKIATGTDDDQESPEFDPSYVMPEKIVDEAEQEMQVELSDKELLKWEKEREKELAAEQEEGDENNEEEEKEKEEKKPSADEESATEKDDTTIEWPDEIDFKTIDLDFLRNVLKNDDPYYPVVKGSDNPYRDGYVTEPPKKPRASYLFFQATMRGFYSEKNPDAVQSELMGVLGETWRGLDEEDKVPFQELANEELKEYERHKVLLDKAQKPAGVWQPLRRCRIVLDRLVKDNFAEIFLEPVDLEDFPDYTEIVESMMDLGTVRKRLDNRKYQAPEQFARDMRRIWNNCKIYNQHGSAIWHLADYMSKQFERLYHAWVLDFRERYLRWAHPKARPWEHSCRIHDGSCGTPDDKMVLCDHCDGMYGLQCVSLKKVPSKAWHCPECKPRLKSTKGTRMLSATAEHAARKRAELGDLPKKKINRMMFLVKWKGLGYEYCTWETKEDIGNDSLVSQYRKREKGYSDESDMPGEIIDKFLSGAQHVNTENAGGNGVFPVLRSQLYAQTRGVHFLKFGKDMPEKLGWAVGPKTSSTGCYEKHLLTDEEKTAQLKHPRAVVECLQDIITRVSRGQRPKTMRSHTVMTPPLTGEYDAIIPITAKGLMMNVGEIHGSVAFLGYRQFSGGGRGPAELAQIVRNVGDKIIAVDGVSTYGKTFKEVINLLKETGKNSFAYMRFLENRFSVSDGSLASIGAVGRYAVEELQEKFANDRRKLVIKRKVDLLEEEQVVQESDDEVSSKDDESDGDSEIGSEGTFAPDSDDEELVDTFNSVDDAPASKEHASRVADQPCQPQEAAQNNDDEPKEGPDLQDVVKSFDEPKTGNGVALPEPAAPKEDELLLREENTRSLSMRLLDADLGYSSDEGGEDECAFYLDGVDSTFATNDEFVAPLSPKKKGQAADKANQQAIIPASKTQFAALGDRSKLVIASAVCTNPPSSDAFETYPLVPANTPVEIVPKTTKRSTVKVEQVDPSNGEVVHIWANIEAAAATLQLPLPSLRSLLKGEYDEETGEEVGGFKWHYALAGAKATAGLDSTTRGGGGKKAKEAWLEFRDKLYDPSEPHSYKNGNRLRDYQVDGVNWLASTWYKRQGCILADEMGLGKTVQIVCYIEHIYRVEKIHRPFLVVVPLSTVEHWRREFEGWTDMVCCVYHDRQRVWRDVMREYEWYYADKPHTFEFLKFDVLVTTYDTLIGDFDVVSQIPFRISVVDEAHRLRNQKGKLLECMREISARGTLQYGFQSRVLMSGTPLQNDLNELWTLLNFIEPFNFPDLEQFQVAYGTMSSRAQVESLQQQISPFMLRRVKEDVAKDIPAKEETVIDVELTSVQKQYYRAIFEHNHAFLNKGNSRQTAPKLMNIQMELRKVCNHPFLLDGIEHRETDRLFREFQESGHFEGKTPEEQHHMINEQGYIMTSGKMVLLDKLLPKLRQEGHKILVFSQMVKMIDLIGEYCDFRGFNYERLDGRVRGSDRQKAIDRFEQEDDSFLFLLSTRAGGVGINLTAADICIIFDSDWNPQNDVQAQARCHRIGQTKDVRIYRLVTSRSFEQEMFDRASKKLGLEQAVLGTFEKEREDDKPSQQEMEQLLKKGAYALLGDDNDEVTREFCADDIETILLKRTRTRVVEGTKTASWLNKQGMSVSKTKFASEGGKGLDMDDPLFWQKVMPDFVSPSIMLQRFRDLEDEMEGKVRGPGRGRWRNKKKEEAESSETKDSAQESLTNGSSPGKMQDDAPGGEEGLIDEDETHKAEETDEEEDDDDDEGKSKKLTRGFIRKVQKFMSELKSMMQSLIEDEEDEGLSNDEKTACQKLLLTISVKQKMFTEEQRQLAAKFLKRFEGDRRRRCRVTDRKFKPGVSEDSTPIVREELMIRGKKRKKRRKRVDQEDEVEVETPKKRAKRADDNESTANVGDDGYLHHSDSEDDWSDVGNDLYDVDNPANMISKKEALRRRQWLVDDDEAAGAGRAWPVFPRSMVTKVLTTLLTKVMKYDDDNGGIFSVPVPDDEFPEYYEQIKKPMDYGTMQKKLSNGEYRSVGAMQRDFLLILQNCRKFNNDTSDIVREAREQHLLRPKFLKEAAAENDLFLAEDGSVLQVVEEKKKASKGKKNGEDGDAASKKKSPKKKGDASETKRGKKKGGKASSTEEVEETTMKKRFRIKARLTTAPQENGDDGDSESGNAKRKRNGSETDHDYASDSAPIPKKPKKEVKDMESGEVSEESSIFLDLDYWVSMRKELNGTFKAARKNLMQHGPWQLPAGLNEEDFANIALSALDEMKKHDDYSLFAKAVSLKEAPDYHEIVKHPMDFSTMRKKVKNGEYGDLSRAAGDFYEDFKQVFDNCLLYNEEGSDVTKEASRVLGLLPETYVTACVDVVKKKAEV